MAVLLLLFNNLVFLIVVCLRSKVAEEVGAIGDSGRSPNRSIVASPVSEFFDGVWSDFKAIVFTVTADMRVDNEMRRHDFD